VSVLAGIDSFSLSFLSLKSGKTKAVSKAKPVEKAANKQREELFPS
jgi:hypothetical protein